MITAEHGAHHQQSVTTTLAEPSATPEQAACTLPVTRAAAPALRHFATTTARGWNLREELHDALALVVTELVTNVILHSGSADVSLRMRCVPTRRTLHVEVEDAGHWRPHAVPAPDADQRYAERGRGLALVEACATSTSVRLTPAGTTVRAELPLS
ncbi:ATP-binding protein [Streptomyces sp. JJ38]|uniref:ATP-binding protein n=1 Tax=Streptomyces sp. JJ38 TaxID=2738128 RepID=UPI001C592DA2|nr:ATP-binding protein [Streptomyces sp. JJ38]MBW1597874.1 ATP-binding protein [Streptomyces sp. JJ38]